MSENNTMRVDIENLLLPDILSEKRFELLKELFEDLNPFQGTEEEVLKTCFTEAALQEGIIASSLLATYIFVGSSHFVHQSPVAIDIANAINTTVENVLILSESPEWKKSVRYWGWRGDPTPKKMREKRARPVCAAGSLLTHMRISKRFGCASHHLRRFHRRTRERRVAV